MNNTVAGVAVKRAILSTINSLYALAIDSVDVLSIRIEYSTKSRLMNIQLFNKNTTYKAYNLVLTNSEDALEELLSIEDQIIEMVSELRDEIEVEA